MTTRDLGYVALFAALIVALGIVPAIPLAGGVPITLQSLGVMLAGLILGPKRGALAAIVVIALVGLGLPVLAGGRGGLGVYAGPTAGFLFGWAPAAFVTGFLAMRLDRAETAAAARFAGLFGAGVAGSIALLYVCGIAWLAFVTKLGLSKAFFVSLPFVPGDLVKAAVAALVTIKVRDAFALDRK
ncbi:MAG: biotin transporter BioY [Hyphomicrobiales bacterium]|nr:biotin transporter BioY [Hyphomicrobiales bacterium]